MSWLCLSKVALSAWISESAAPAEALPPGASPASLSSEGGGDDGEVEFVVKNDKWCICQGCKEKVRNDSVARKTHVCKGGGGGGDVNGGGGDGRCWRRRRRCDRGAASSVRETDRIITNARHVRAPNGVSRSVDAMRERTAPAALRGEH